MKCNKNRCVLFVQSSNTIHLRFGVTGSEDMEAIEDENPQIS